MDGPFYVDTRAPHIAGDAATVTVGATNKALVPLANLPVLGANYFSWIGKAVRIRLFGRWSTAAAAGTQTFQMNWGTGADNNGTAIFSSSPAIVPANSLTNVPWLWETVIRCRTLGATGTLFATSQFTFNNSNTAATAMVGYMIPGTAPAVSGSLDLTAANVISPQVLATTSTTNTMTVHDYLFEALN